MTGLYELGSHIAQLQIPPPQFEGATPTIRRRLNLYLLMWEWYQMQTRLRSKPARLCIESTGACNLSCPHCFTGSGEVGRERSSVSLDLYRRVLAELGDHLWQIEFHNWGEPLLNKNVFTMIADATRRGLSTSLCTNFSFPFGEERAEQLVRSGLKLLGVSIDGAGQETYEQYRVGGRLDVVIRNCRLVAEAKRRLGSRTPRAIWAFHIFAHNRDDVAAAEATARALGMDFHASRGRVVGADWDPQARWVPHDYVAPIPCYTLWHTAVVMSDGGVAPCRGSFYPQDDMGRLTADGPPFLDVWNGERFRVARRFYSRREGTPEERQRICFNCPHTIDFERFLHLVLAGGKPEDWTPAFNSNERFNYFWTRRPPGAPVRPRVRRTA
jgi:hypothetical protein